jgi:lipid II:glycine glycyltransferase (peptidoglycan interpeptide bridge formation enzyme)
LRFYEYQDPFNTESYADLMRSSGFGAVRLNRTYFYVRRTLFGSIGQVYYPTEEVRAPSKVRFLEVQGLLDPLPDAMATDYTNTVHIRLDDSFDAVTKSLNKTRRWGIRKALERGAQAYPTDTQDAFDSFWEIYMATAKRQNIHVMSREFLKRVFGIKELARLFVVEAKNQTIGAYLTLYSEDLARYFYGGFLYEFKDYHPNELGHYSAIQHFHEKGLKVYDMGGAGKNPQQGDFKVGWGKLLKIYRCQFYSSKFMAKTVENYRKAKVWFKKHYRR